MSESTRFGFDHLDRLSDQRGLFEHAAGTVRREEHGYCTDDNARLLVVASRQRDPADQVARRLGRAALDFVLVALDGDGRCHNRMDRSGRWIDRVSTEDCWGRSVWGLGTAAAHHLDASIRRRARKGFDVAVRQRSPWRHAMAFAALGAAEVLAIDADDEQARSLLGDALVVIGPIPDGSWAWPEPRLAYANAALAEAVIAAGAALGNTDDVGRGLTMLRWLLALETGNGHLSVAGVGGRGPDDDGPQFDQQPIEVAAMADACWRAHAVTGDRRWCSGITAAAQWFDGDNDSGVVMYDSESGGGFDGLRADGANINQGAESTIALVSTMQRAASFAPAP